MSKWVITYQLGILGLSHTDPNLFLTSNSHGHEDLGFYLSCGRGLYLKKGLDAAKRIAWSRRRFTEILLSLSFQQFCKRHQTVWRLIPQLVGAIMFCLLIPLCWSSWPACSPENLRKNPPHPRFNRIFQWSSSWKSTCKFISNSYSHGRFIGLVTCLQYEGIPLQDTKSYHDYVRAFLGDKSNGILDQQDPKRSVLFTVR